MSADPLGDARAPAGRSAGAVTARDVVDSARAIVEADGVEALTMRRLSEVLDVAVTSVYWHVGRRDEVLDAVVAQFVSDMGTLTVVGTSPRERIASAAGAFRQRLLEHPHLVAVAYQRDQMAPILRPIRAALMDEFAAVGQGGDELALSILAIEAHVVSSTLLELSIRRNPPVTGADSWPAELADPSVVGAYDRLVGTSTVFDVGLDALVTALIHR